MFLVMLCLPYIVVILLTMKYCLSSVGESKFLEFLDADAAKSSPPTPTSKYYTIPPGFQQKEFKEVWGCPFPGSEPQYFLALYVAPGGLHYCFRTSTPIPLSFWVVILRNDENSDDMDPQFSSYSRDWKVEFDAPRVLALCKNSNITWNGDWDNFHFDDPKTDPKTISKLRDKLGLPPSPFQKGATPQTPAPIFDLSKTQLKLDPFNVHYQTLELTREFAYARGVAAGNHAAPYKPPLEPPVGGEERWIQQASHWIEYALSPGNGVVQELITRRAQYLQNMKNPKKKQFDALNSFNDVNRQLRKKFLLPPRDELNFFDALKNNDDVADFLRANNLME
jgi:hypothetical protein